MKKVLVVLLVILIVIQFFRPEKNQGQSPTATNVMMLYPASDSVKNIMQVACYDCHTNKTVYPWYANIQPVAWWLADHVEEGKEHCNYDDFGTWSLRKQYHKMEETIEMVKENEMPLDSYTWMHPKAKLTNEQRSIITGWAQSVMDSMQRKYPIDSLVRKK